MSVGPHDKETIDNHPLRYSPLTSEIEAILFARSMSRRLEGYTLETALEIAEAMTKRMVAAIVKR